MGDIIVPGLTHWASPNFFAYFPSNASPPSSSFTVEWQEHKDALGYKSCGDKTGKGDGWLAVLLALPKQFLQRTGGGVSDSASSATLMRS